jgi:hypothetical protein
VIPTFTTDGSVRQEVLSKAEFFLVAGSGNWCGTAVRIYYEEMNGVGAHIENP